jgi:adenylate kinase
VLKQHIAKIPSEKGILFDGYPRTLEQAKSLDSIVKIDVIILLEVPDWIIIERLSARRICKNCGAVYNTRFLKPKVEGVCDKCGGSLYLRSDDNPEVIKKRLEVYQSQTSPLLQFYRDKQVPFILSKTTSLETSPDMLADEMIADLKKLNLA